MVFGLCKENQYVHLRRVIEKYIPLNSAENIPERIYLKRTKPYFSANF